MNELTTRILRILVLVFAVVLASTIFYHLLFQNYETENAIYYEVRDSSPFEGVYVRNETVQRYTGTGALRYCVDDGAKLGVGSTIAEVYADESQIDLRRRIAQMEEQLTMLNRIENPGTAEHAQPANLSALIRDQYRSMIRLRERGDLASMLAGRQDLSVYMSTYEKITHPETDLQSRIAALEDEISRLNMQKTEPEYTIRADRSAYFISYVDGYEDLLKADNVRQLAPEQIDAVSDDGIRNVDPQAIGKLVDDYSWYIVGRFDNTKLRLSEDNTASVRLESLNRNLRVKVVSLVSTGDITQTQAVLRCDQFTYDTVQHRKERVEIMRDRNTIEGIRVPNSAIRFKVLDEPVLDSEGKVQKDDQGNTITQQTDTMGVYVLVGESAEFRKLDIIYEDEEFCLSRMDAGTGYVSLYDDIIVKGVMADGGS